MPLQWSRTLQYHILSLEQLALPWHVHPRLLRQKFNEALTSAPDPRSTSLLQWDRCLFKSTGKPLIPNISNWHCWPTHIFRDRNLYCCCPCFDLTWRLTVIHFAKSWVLKIYELQCPALKMTWQAWDQSNALVKHHAMVANFGSFSHLAKELRKKLDSLFLGWDCSFCARKSQETVVLCYCISSMLRYRCNRHITCIRRTYAVYTLYIITIWLFNIAMENPHHKWRVLAGKIIYFYGP